MVILLILHLTAAAVWFGAMAYSLAVVQPRITRFFPTPRAREDFLLLLAQGNRWKVAPLIGFLALSGLALGLAVPAVLYLAAGVVFVNVSWRHWPSRLFALPEELPGYQRRLRVQAWTMLGLVGAAFVVALAVSVRP
ncbi:hypothetical protein [Nonomuraea sp. SYSU D8015]|uniref:hypothetical protein n=1 Tax=Nonomuraea sp. SYSU D8015 TaxID=2593644 RepID=UPI001CB7329E|nr:hypothetical protein [Nonomuraea sp. SYSU D8015]